MDKYPLKDPDTKKWIYNTIPEEMQLATSLRQIQLNTFILYKSTFSSFKGFYVATKVTLSNIDCVKYYLERGNVYVKKSGV